MLVCSSPRLIAALHVLLRLPVPRHPSCALSSLTTKNYSYTSMSCLYAIRLWQSCFACLYGIISLHLTSLFFNEHQHQTLILSQAPLHAELISRMVGVLGFEPRTSSLSGTRSNQLSYTPEIYQTILFPKSALLKHIWWSLRDSNP